MKKLFLISPLLIALSGCYLSGCTGRLANVGRIWPDGASVSIDRFNATASMTGAGNITLEGVRWTGTNGFPIPGTNVATTVKP